MYATLHLVRPRPGRAPVDRLRLFRSLPDTASFARPLVSARLTRLPFPVPSMVSYGLFTTWADEATASAFATDFAASQAGSADGIHLTLRALRARGDWLSQRPLDGARADGDDGGPVLFLTRASTTRLYQPEFWRANRKAVGHLRAQPELLWDMGWADRLLRVVGTLSLWSGSEPGARFAYAAGGHRQAIEGSRANGWLSDSYFARFAVHSKTGTWPGLSEHLSDPDTPQQPVTASPPARSPGGPR